MYQARLERDSSPAGGVLKTAFFIVFVTTAFALGLYMLFLASVNAGNVRPTNIAGLIRTASPADVEQINNALGNLSQQDFVYVVMDTAKAGLDPNVKNAARSAARALSDTGMAVSVRIVAPGDPDFKIIVGQNGINQFPAVLAVMKDGGIVLVRGEINEKNLLHAYHAVWGKSSSCDDAKSGVY